MTDWEPPLMALLALQRRLERGPKREGAFALWLLVRLAMEIGVSDEGTGKGDRRRMALVGQRLSQLVVPRTLSRGLVAALGHLEESTPAAAVIALMQLIAPAREALGDEAGNAVAAAVSTIRDQGVQGDRRG